ncbi:rhodanese-like domain-containing protein [Rhizobiales bacterium]|uniref:rhodanese-like domain-containing protein n=1 Tax=Hongsoonwoonella zoysiae TaxID=2821844 RepID=UPI001560B99B|nr:rhodanese-like domain-containing protein [Hongsoonwoonella zoysiae]NRG19197.1 rhodanese-like domain-containing protein [Hongsoonwoonella zoysiae]
MPARMKKGYRALIDEAMAEVKTLSVAEARELHENEDVVFVDIRDVRELKAQGSVPGALHAPRGMLEFWVDPESPYHKSVFSEDKTFVLYCAAGWRSALATKTLQDMGLEKVAHIEGGFGAWTEAGFPVEKKEK